MNKEQQWYWEIDIQLFINNIPTTRVVTVNRDERKKIYAAEEDKELNIDGVKFRKSNIINEHLKCYLECRWCRCFVDNKIYKVHLINCPENTFSKYKTYWKPETRGEYWHKVWHPESKILINK